MAEPRLVRLGEVADFLTGFPFKSANYTDEALGIRLIRGDNIVQGAIRWDGVKRWPAHLAEQNEEYRLFPGDVVLAMDRPWIEAGLKYAALSDDDCPSLLVQRVTRLRGTQRIDKGFLRYVIGGRDFTDYVLAVQTGTAVPHISGGQIKAFQFLLPEIAEQRSIASVLGALDNKIEINRRMNDTLEAMARAIFRDWFVDFGPTRAKAEGRPFYLGPDIWALFPGRLDNEGKPEGWHMKPLAEVTSKIGSGATPTGGSQVYTEAGTALIRSQNVYDHQFTWNGLARISEGAAKKLNGVEVFEGDILINITGDSILRCCVVDREVLPARVNQHVAIVRAKPEIPYRFIHQYLVMRRTKETLLGFDAGGSRAAVTKAHLERLPVLFPGNQALAAFDKITSPLFDRMESNCQENRALAQTRDLLLPKLMSGEIRVRDAERALETAA